MKKMKKRTNRLINSVEAYAACRCACGCGCGCGCRGLFANSFRRDIPSRITSLMHSGAAASGINDFSV